MTESDPAPDDDHDDDYDDHLAALLDAIGELDDEAAFEIAGDFQPHPDDGLARLAVATAHHHIGENREARRQLEELASLDLDGDDEYTRITLLAEVLLQLGLPEEALALLGNVEPGTPEDRAAHQWTSGLCHDHLGDRERADRCFERAHADLPEEYLLPVSIPPEEVVKITRLVREQLPAPIQALFDELSVVIDDLPALEWTRRSDGEISPDVLGLYTGSNIHDRSVFQGLSPPNEMFLFRRNLERCAPDRGELVRQIEITFLHELGHHLGYDENDLDGLGLA